jgi:hypothetical protein
MRVNALFFGPPPLGSHMVSRLNPEDFRAYRLILDPDDFAIGDDEPNSAPTDLISQHVWEAITTLPGDVAIRTANHQGTRIAILHDLHVGWLGVMPEPGILSDAMLEVGDDFDAAMFNLAWLLQASDWGSAERS